MSERIRETFQTQSRKEKTNASDYHYCISVANSNTISTHFTLSKKTNKKVKL